MSAVTDVEGAVAGSSDGETDSDGEPPLLTSGSIRSCSLETDMLPVVCLYTKAEEVESCEAAVGDQRRRADGANNERCLENEVEPEM